MIVKELTVPERIIALEALLRRLEEGSPEWLRVKEDLAKRWAGYYGELSLDYYLQMLPEKEYLVLHDLRLGLSGSFFQIDILVVHAHFALILEVKNILGTLVFDKQFSQMIRTHDEKEEGFPNPIAQAEQHKKQLARWFAERSIPLPAEALVVISKPSTVLKANSPAISRTVIHSHRLLGKVEELSGRYQQALMDAKELRKTSKLLIKNHTPEEIDILSKMRISPDNVRMGVHCGSCGHIPAVRVYGTWLCPKCGAKDKSAHISALQDYFLLFGKEITNGGFREFSGVESVFAASRLLKGACLPSNGEKKGTTYFATEEFMK
ncbi:NERD domain-containing protein [Bacillus infantis]|uniref:nuclease-related domain-containing protein n=1 Tax=Bacillus infantis TaxID=324767 RepID=UPI001CD482C3|nr:nuclease-related domain-containing protein [Bacillus infantis]MCA1040383.1 NERD domain-containing protein [Bacillus infantis]